MYKGQIPIASRAAIKLLSRVSRRTNANMPSNISTNSSPYSSYCVKVTLKGHNPKLNRLMIEGGLDEDTEIGSKSYVTVKGCKKQICDLRDGQ